MDHDRAQSMFTGYHDGELAPADVTALEAHLADCHECALAWQGYKAAVEEVSGLLKVAPAPDFSKRVQQTIGRRSRGRFFSEQSDNSGMGVALVSVILVLVFALLYIIVAGAEVQVVPLPSDEPSSPDTTGAGAEDALSPPAEAGSGSP